MIFLRRPALALLALLCGCGPAAQSGPQAAAPATPTPVPLHIETQGSAGHPATFSESARNRLIYMVKSKSSVGDRLGDGDFVVVLSTPHVTFFDKGGKTLVGDAPKAVVMERSKTITMSGGVTAHTQGGATLTCRTLTYDGNVERIHGVGDVVLTSPHGDRLTGDTIDGDVRLNHVTVNGGR